MPSKHSLRERLCSRIFVVAPNVFDFQRVVKLEYDEYDSLSHQVRVMNGLGSLQNFDSTANLKKVSKTLEK